MMKAAIFVEKGRIVLDDKPIPDIAGFHLAVLFVMLFLALLYWSLNSWHSSRLGVRAALRKARSASPPYIPAERPTHIVGADEQWVFWLPRSSASARISSRPATSRSAGTRDFVKQPSLSACWQDGAIHRRRHGLVYIFDRYWLSERTQGKRSALEASPLWSSLRRFSLA